MAEEVMAKTPGEQASSRVASAALTGEKPMRRAKDAMDRSPTTRATYCVRWAIHSDPPLRIEGMRSNAMMGPETMPSELRPFSP